MYSDSVVEMIIDCFQRQMAKYKQKQGHYDNFLQQGDHLLVCVVSIFTEACVKFIVAYWTEKSVNYSSC